MIGVKLYKLKENRKSQSTISSISCSAKQLLLEPLLFSASHNVGKNVAMLGPHVSHQAVLTDEGAAALIAAAWHLLPVR